MTGQALSMRNMPRNAREIPNIDLAKLYEGSAIRAGVQHETIGRLAELMGRDPVPHRHDDCLQIHFIETGHFDLQLDNVKCSGEAPVVFLTPPSVPHVFSLSPDATGHVLTVRQELLWQLARQDPCLPDRERLHPFCASLARREHEEVADDLRTGFELLARELRRGRREDETAIRSLSAFLIAKTFRTRTDDGRAPSANASQLALYRRFLALVEDHFADHWPMSRYADRLNITQSRLYELCQYSAGQSPKSILSNRLVQETRRYLTFSDAHIKEVAAALGFEDASYFFRFFKRLTGETPSAYRDRIRSAAQPEKVQ